MVARDDNRLQNTGVPRSGELAGEFSFVDRLREISMFFQGNDAVHQTMRRVAAALDRENIPYAIVGGMAVNAHKYQRTTADVDFLLNVAGFSALKQLVVNGEFSVVPGRPRRFLDSTTGIAFDILVTGRFPGSGAPGPVVYPDPTAVSENIRDLRVINLPGLIDLKLAARRHRDFADVVSLIEFNNLDESFAEKLHPAVRTDYLSCVDEQRREADYEAQQDRLAEEE